MIGIVVGPDSWTELTIPERRRRIIHTPAPWWLGPACNFGNDPAVKLIVGQEVRAETFTCWRCLHPGEAAAMDAERAKRGVR